MSKKLILNHVVSTANLKLLPKNSEITKSIVNCGLKSACTVNRYLDLNNIWTMLSPVETKQIFVLGATPTSGTKTEKTILLMEAVKRLKTIKK